MDTLAEETKRLALIRALSERIDDLFVDALCAQTRNALRHGNVRYVLQLVQLETRGRERTIPVDGIGKNGTEKIAAALAGIGLSLKMVLSEDTRRSAVEMALASSFSELTPRKTPSLAHPGELPTVENVFERMDELRQGLAVLEALRLRATCGFPVSLPPNAAKRLRRIRRYVPGMTLDVRALDGNVDWHREKIERLGRAFDPKGPLRNAYELIVDAARAYAETD